MNIQEYKKIAQIGDIIETNADGDNVRYERDDNDNETDNEIWEKYEITKITDYYFLCKNDDYADWRINWDNELATINLITSAIKEPDKTSTKKTKKRQSYIELENHNGTTIISIKLPKELEEYFKNTSENKTKTSKNWKLENNEPALFYLLSDKLDQTERSIDKQTFSDYGDGLIKGDKINTAILRTIGTNKGVKIKGNFGASNNIDLEYYVKRLAMFIKVLWETSISKKKVKSTITFEL
jgi:hypothetical protein